MALQQTEPKSVIKRSEHSIVTGPSKYEDEIDSQDREKQPLPSEKHSSQHVSLGRIELSIL
jgi:hypothetical protein